MPHKDCAADAKSDCTKNLVGILAYVKRFMCNMPENMQADDLQTP